MNKRNEVNRDATPKAVDDAQGGCIENESKRAFSADFVKEKNRTAPHLPRTGEDSGGDVTGNRNGPGRQRLIWSGTALVLLFTIALEWLDGPKPVPDAAVVAEIQDHLDRLGYNVPKDGQVDERTARSVRDFEQTQGLMETGRPDQALLEKLIEEYERRELVTKIQTELRRLGRVLTVDGVVEEDTTFQIHAFERAMDRTESGVPSRSLLAELQATDHWPILVLEPGETFQDCADCPEMVVIPAGTFRMGSPPGELHRGDDEGPQRQVSVPTFALAKTEVTYGQWFKCAEAGDCSYQQIYEQPPGSGVFTLTWPVTDISWNDAQVYVRWLSKTTGKHYRLPSEAEWEYAARADTTTRFHTGDCITEYEANFDGSYLAEGCRWGNEHKVGYTTSKWAGGFAPNSFGLHDMHGNVWEWVQDCWNPIYQGGPEDGSAWMSGDCDLKVLRGGSWTSNGPVLRSANRHKRALNARVIDVGFRPAMSLEQ